MKIEHVLRYDATTAHVHTMLTDRAFRERVSEQQHVTGCTVTVESTGSSTTVVVDSTRPADGIPGFAKKFVGDTIHIVQTEKWTDANSAVLDVAIPGKPVHLTGDIMLVADGESTVQTIRGELKVAIPLVGGKIEKLIDDLLGKASQIEERVGRTWLSGRSMRDPG